jgi:hypothetical protein
MDRKPNSHGPILPLVDPKGALGHIRTNERDAQVARQHRFVVTLIQILC